MNIERLQQLKELIAIDVAKDPALFDMGVIGDPICQTPGCIIGWGMAMVPPKDVVCEYSGFISELKTLQTFFDINEYTSDRLFIACGTPNEIRALEIAPEEAIRTIDTLIATGIPTWSRPEVQAYVELSIKQTDDE